LLGFSDDPGALQQTKKGDTPSTYETLRFAIRRKRLFSSRRYDPGRSAAYPPLS
jgi:hypothetical protein